MSDSKRQFLSFRSTCLTVCVLDVFMAGGLLARGITVSMGPFGVPAVVLASPHYNDAILWVYSHMIVLGLIIGVLGLFAEGAPLKLWMARLLCGAHAYYTYLDARSSDSFLGNGLYQGAASNFPPLVALAFTLLFARLSFRPEPDPAAVAPSK